MTPLHNPEAEMSTLGAMILSEHAVESITSMLGDDDFYSHAHREIFTAIRSLADRHQAVDLLTVKNELEGRGKLAEVGGEDYLIQVAEVLPSAANAAHYARIVKDKSTLRKLDSAGTQIQQLTRDTDITTDEKVEAAERLVFAIGQQSGDADWVHAPQIAMRIMSDLDHLIESGEDSVGIQTGFYDLDALTTGLYDTDFIVIGARPSMGKTAFALKVALNVARSTGKRVAFFSMEMGYKQLGRRLVSMLSGIGAATVKRQSLGSNEYRMIADGCELMYALPLSVNETGSISIPKMRAKLRRLKREKGVCLVVVDYLQLMSGTGRKGDNRTQEVDDIAKGLKGIAMEFGMPVIALAQLNRDVERRENKRPMLADLRESGDIEAAADIVAFLYRDDYYKARENPEEANPDPDRWEVAELIVSKHRNGDIGTIKLGFQPKTTNFESVKV